MSGFVKLPQEHAEAWYALKYWDRALGADLFRMFGNDETIDVPMSMLGDVVCRALAVDGRDRPTVKRALKRIEAAGLLVPDGARTRLLYSRRAYRQWHANGQGMTSEPTGNGSPMDGESSVNGQGTVSETDLSPRNPSKDAPVDREIERGEERETRGRAREEPPPPPADESPHRADALSVLRAFQEHTSWMGSLQATDCLPACVEIAGALRAVGWSDVEAGASDLVSRWWTPERQRRIYKIHPRRLADDLDEMLRERRPSEPDEDPIAAHRREVREQYAEAVG